MSNSNSSEYRTSTETGTGYISGVNFGPKKVTYSVIDGMAIFEGDIVLGTVEEMERISKDMEKLPSDERKAVVISGGYSRWLNEIIPFRIDVTLPDQQRVTDAIRHWENNTPIRFVQRTNERNFVTFRPGARGTNCSSPVGMRGGQQFITLESKCGLGNTIHEIGHTVGLWHEQSREDRDKFVRILWNNIISKEKHNFNQHISDGDDVGDYDYCSIMHYSPVNGFSTPPTAPTFQVLQTSRPCASTVGQRGGLSAGDIAAARQMYSILLTSGPGAGGSHVFARGTDNALWHRFCRISFTGLHNSIITYEWRDWESLGGIITSDPAVGTGFLIPLRVYARGTDNALWYQWLNNRGQWSGWESLGGTLTSGPGAAGSHVFAKGTDNALWYKWVDNKGQWSGWESLGGVITSDPAAGTGFLIPINPDPNYRFRLLHVYARGADNALWYQWLDNKGQWSGWESLGETLTSGPGAAGWHVFARGEDNGLLHRFCLQKLTGPPPRYNNRVTYEWRDWEYLGGIITSDPAAGTGFLFPTSLNRRIPYRVLHVYARGTDNALWYKWLDDRGKWSGWEKPIGYQQSSL